jgi:hypothetical protein
MWNKQRRTSMISIWKRQHEFVGFLNASQHGNRMMRENLWRQDGEFVSQELRTVLEIASKDALRNTLESALMLRRDNIPLFWRAKVDIVD